MGRAAGRPLRALGAMVLLAVQIACARAEDGRDYLIQTTTFFGGFGGDVGHPPGRFIKLINPSALAAFGNDLYVADQGQGTVFRIDVASQRVEPIASIARAGTVRLRTGSDGSLYILSPDRSDIVRLLPGGHSIRYGDTFAIPKPADMVLLPQAQQLWVADGFGSLFEFTPLGQAQRKLGHLASGSRPTLLIAAGNHVVGLDDACACAIVIGLDGEVIGRFGEDTIRSPVAADFDRYGRLWISNDGGRELEVFRGEILEARIASISLGLAQVSALAFDFDRAYLADGLAGRINAYTVLPSREDR